MNYILWIITTFTKQWPPWLSQLELQSRAEWERTFISVFLLFPHSSCHCLRSVLGPSSCSFPSIHFMTFTAIPSNDDKHENVCTGFYNKTWFHHQLLILSIKEWHSATTHLVEFSSNIFPPDLYWFVRWYHAWDPCE
jgi:hypothetical protein